MADHRADIKDMDGVNADKLFEAIEVDFENIMNQESFDKKVQFNDKCLTKCLIGLSDGSRREICAAFENPSVEHSY